MEKRCKFSPSFILYRRANSIVAGTAMNGWEEYDHLSAILISWCRLNTLNEIHPWKLDRIILIKNWNLVRLKYSNSPLSSQTHPPTNLIILFTSSGEQLSFTPHSACCDSNLNPIFMNANHNSWSAGEGACKWYKFSSLFCFESSLKNGQVINYSVSGSVNRFRKLPRMPIMSDESGFKHSPLDRPHYSRSRQTAPKQYIFNSLTDSCQSAADSPIHWPMY